jgi:DNA polymerase-3 subunit alpha
MKDNFVHLHNHSTYSFTDGYGLPEQYISRAVEIGQPGLAVTDHGNISAHYKWYKQCNKAGIKPILGCEMYIVKNKEDIREREYNHIILLVKNNVGYKNLMKLVTKAWCEQFYYKPRITYQDLFDNQEGLIVLSGCLSSPFMELLKKDRADACYKLFKEFNNKLDDFYVEMQAISFPEGKDAYLKLIQLYKEKLQPEGFKMVATNDCHYVLESQSKVQEVLLCVQSNDTMDNPDHWHFDQNDFYLKTRQEMEAALNKAFPDNDFTEALDNTVKIAESIDFTFPTAKPISFPMKEENKLLHLTKMCNDGLKQIGKENNAVYRARLERELSLISQKNFVDYFLVISDLINWAKHNGILVGHGRGSAAGSLACYCLRITEVDPMEYGLIFERFIDINRADLPDIDIDFQDTRRHEVKEYLQKKYGHDKVGTLPTFSEFKGKSALADIGRVYKIPFKVIDEIKDLVLERSGGDSRAGFTLEDTFTNPTFTKPAEAMVNYPELKYAIALEGQYRQMGQHAAGVVISNEPITNFCAMYKVRDEIVLSMDYKDVTDIGLLKIDVLGLSTLSVISKALALIKERHGKTIDPYTIPLDDKKTYKGFLDEKLFGVFQFDGQAVNQVCRQIRPKDFETVAAISALARPGPLNSGNTTEFIMRRNGKAPITYTHAIMESITGDTYGVVIYQEQVMRIMREIGDMSWEDTSAIRKNMSRSLGVEAFNAFRSKFMPGAIGHGLKEEVASKIWDEMCSYGSWAFNKSHAISYGLISYVTMWLKMHYPIEFYAAILALTEDEEKRKKIIKEYKREGLKILPIHINKSKQEFAIEDKGLRLGFKDIKGIGDSVAERLVNNQPYRSFQELIALGKGKKVSDKVLQILADLGALDDIEKESTVLNLFGESEPLYKKNNLSFEERFHLCPWDIDFGIEKTWMPYILENSKTFKELPIPIDSLKDRKSGFNEPEVVIYGIVYDKNMRDIREVSATKGKTIDLEKYHGLYRFANFVVEDDTDFVTCRLSHMKYPEYGNLIFEQTKVGDVVIIRGKMGSGIRMLFVNKVLNLRLHKEKNEKQLSK